MGTSTFPAAEIVEAQWVAERRGLERFRTEQPPYSILANRIIERDVLPVTQRYGMGTLIWSPLAQGLLTGRGSARTGQTRLTARASMPVHFDHDGEAHRGRATRRARRAGRTPDEPPGDGLRRVAPGRDLGDHRPPHHGPARRPPGRRRSHVWTTTSSTGSTRSPRPVPRPAPTTSRTHRPLSSIPPSAAAPPCSAPPPDRRRRHQVPAPPTTRRCATVRLSLCPLQYRARCGRAPNTPRPPSR